MAKYRHAKGLSPLQILLIVGITVVVLGLIAGTVFAVSHFNSDKEEPTTPTTVTKKPISTIDQTPTEPATEDENEKYTALAKEYMSTMTQDEKIHQMLMVTPEALTGVDVATLAGDATKEAIENYPIGGIYYSASNFEDEQQTNDLIKNSQSYAKTPMFIAVSDEGGDNSPLASRFNATTTDNIYNKSGDAVVENYASSLALNLTKFGVNFNLAPCANIDGEYIFSTSEKSASELAVSALKGFSSKGVIPAVKHFPVQNDSSKTLDELREAELTTFASAIDSGADVIKMSSAKVSAIEDTPSYLSQRTVTELLVKEMRFDGLVVSADMSDSEAQAVVSAIKAGNNLILCPADIEATVEAIKIGIAGNEISQQQIESSVTKILALKLKYGILETATPKPETNTETTGTTAQ